MSERRPTWTENAWFQFRATGLRLRQALRNTRSQNAGGTRFNAGEYPFPLSRSVVELVDPDDHEVWNLGKILNIKTAAAKLDGLHFKAGSEFRFWRFVGPPWRLRGFVPGRELRNGCLIPTIGGGLCQLSGALFESAARAGFEITERHRHSRSDFANAPVAGREATVFWNYLDLRFRISQDAFLSCRVEKQTLIVEWRVKTPANLAPESRPVPTTQVNRVRDCISCGEMSCQVRKTNLHSLRSLQTLEIQGQPSWTSFRYQIFRVYWRVFRRNATAAERSVRESKVIARSLRRQILCHKGHLVLPQTLLPELWRQGWLSGKSFSVQLQRLPLDEINKRLDEVAAQRPGRASLVNYRASEELVQAERSAFAAATKLQTTHFEIARVLGLKCGAVDFQWRPRHRMQMRRALLFPGPIAWREGLEAVIEFAKANDYEVLYLGAQIEPTSVWNEVRAKRIRRDAIPWDEVAFVLHPTFFTSRFDLYREALENGVPIVVSRGAGVTEGPGRFVIDPETNINQLNLNIGGFHEQIP